MNKLDSILAVHKNCLPNDPIYAFRKNKIKSFFKSLLNKGWIKTVTDKNGNIKCFSIVIPLYKILEFMYIIFLASFAKSLSKSYLKINNSNVKRCGLLIYVCVAKEKQNQGFGSNLIRSYSSDFTNILFLTKKETYEKFYKKMGSNRIKIFNRCLCNLPLE